MNEFQIESTAGVILGIYQGERERDALNTMAREAGYPSIEAMDEVSWSGDLIVFKI